MAYLFFAGKMLSQDADSQLTGALYKSSGNPAALKNGALLVLGNLLADTTYVNSGDYEYDVYEATAPAAATDEVVIADISAVNGGMIGDNYYKMGVELYNLEAPANEIVRVRRLHLHDKFYLGEDNFVSTPTVGQYAEATAGSILHTPAATPTGGQYAIKILKKDDLTVGMESKGSKYLCEVVDL